MKQLSDDDYNILVEVAKFYEQSDNVDLVMKGHGIQLVLRKLVN